jgi:peptidyl-prolyl cis-trans isomerase A (cyclophilin A)
MHSNNMTKQISYISTISVAFLVACGGGSGGSSSTTPAVDTVAPTMTELRTNFVSTGKITLTAIASDNVSVEGYCFNASSVAPLSNDACFETAGQRTVNLTLPQQRIYAWAKDAAGNVTTSPMVGPCSSSGFSASDASTLETVCMMTSQGEMVFALEAVKAPITVENYLKYVNDGFYSNTVFHRVMSNFMVQGGGYTGSSASNYIAKTPTYPPITLEAPSVTGLSNKAGTIAMARTTDLNSATSQFFINVVDNTNLDTTGIGSVNGGGYAVFGSLISGDSALASIKSVPVMLTSSGVPSSPVVAPVINWAIRLK